MDTRTAIEHIARHLARSRRVLFITGAGISADSGLPTYRGVGGLYNDEATEDGLPIETALSGAVFSVRPDITWKYLAQIAHNCRIGRSCVICGQTSLAGSVVLGDGVMLGGSVGVADNVEISDVKPIDAPSAAAWALLVAVRRSPRQAEIFWGQMYVKSTPTKLLDDGAGSVHLVDAVHWRGRAAVNPRTANLAEL